MIEYFVFLCAASDALFPIKTGKCGDGKAEEHEEGEEEENKGDDSVPRAERDSQGGAGAG